MRGTYSYIALKVRLQRLLPTALPIREVELLHQAVGQWFADSLRVQNTSQELDAIHQPACDNPVYHVQ